MLLQAALESAVEACCLDHTCDPSQKVGRFLKRSACGDWRPYEQGLYQTANAVIWACYMIIPAILLYAARFTVRIDPNDPDLHLSRPAVLYGQLSFALFIMACGYGHLEGVVAFSWPRYDVFMWFHVITATVSINAVVACWVLRQAIISRF